MFAKFYKYIQLTFVNMFRNKVRMILTIAGICIGLITFIIGNSYMNSKIENNYKKAYQFSPYSCIISGSYDIAHGDKKVDSIIRNIDFAQHNTVAIGPSYEPILPTYIFKNTIFCNRLNLIGYDSTITTSTICYDSEHTTNLKLLAGRDFTTDELSQGSNVIIIEKSTAQLLFQSYDCIAKKVSLKKNDGEIVQFTIIGMVYDTNETKDKNLELNKRLLENEKNENINDQKKTEYNNLKCFTTKKAVKYMSIEQPIDIHFLSFSKEDKQKADVLLLNEQKDIYEKGYMIAILSRESLLKDADRQTKMLKNVMSVGMILLIIISGFIVLTVVLFSVKERVFEIGIRRALGASSFDIIMQFIVEGIIFSLIATVISLFISIHSCNIISYIMTNIFYTDLTLKIDTNLMTATMSIALFQGIIYSFFPALYASRIKPTEAIRWD